MKRLIFLLAILLWAGQAGAETSWWISPGGAIIGYDDLIPQHYTNPSGEWQKIQTIPIPPDPFYDVYHRCMLNCQGSNKECRKKCQKFISQLDCPWRIKVVPEAEAEKWMNEGWEPFGIIPIFDLDIRGNGDFHFYGNEQYKIYLKKRVTEEKP